MIVGLIGVALGSLTSSACGQGIDYNSVAGEGALNHASDTPNSYNLMAGPVAFSVAATELTSFNDNVNIAQYGRQADVIFTPQVNFSGNWQATDENNLTFGLGIGYQYYLEHSGYSGPIITPSNTSGTQFNMVVGNVKIDLHDFLSFQQNPVNEGQLSNIGQFPVFTNDAGMKVSWNFNEDIVLSVGYDHINEWVFDSQYNYLNSATDSISPAITYNFSKTIQAGFNASVTSLRYQQTSVMNNSESFTTGPFVTSQLSEYVSVTAQCGLQYATYDSGGSIQDNNSNLLSWYGSFGISHKINDFLNESFTAGQQFVPGINSNYTQEVFATYSPSWQATSFLSVSASLSFQNLNDSSSVNSQSSDIIQTSLNANYSLTDHASVNLGYQYVLKAADTAALGYYQNQVNIGFNYQF